MLRDIVQLVTLILNDKKPDYVLTAENLNRVLDLVNRKIFKGKLEQPEANGRKQDELSKFLCVMGNGSQPLVFVNGIAFKPLNHFYTLAINDAATGFKVEMVSELQWNERTGNAITKPTLRDPIVRDLGDRFQIAPPIVQYCNFVHYRLPDTPVYNPNGTDIEFEYDKLTELEVIPLILNEIGFSIPNAELIAYTQKEAK